MAAESDKPSALRFAAPRFWPLWLGLALWWLVAQLPYRAQLLLGRLLGDLMYLTLARRRHIARVNLGLCFPELDATSRHRLLRETFRSSGISLLETATAWWGRDAMLAPLNHVEGLEHLDAAQADGKGVILLSAHFTCLEIGGRLLSQHRDFHVVYKYHRNPLFERVMKHGRERHFEEAIERSDIRSMIKVLKKGHNCWFALDQDFGYQNAVFAPFMGMPAATLTSTSRIARLTGCAVVPFFVRRLPGAQGYQLSLLPALENFPSGDDLADATRTNALIEAEIRKAPAQYLWVHRRFKSRPEGAADVYR